MRVRSGPNTALQLDARGASKLLMLDNESDDVGDEGDGEAPVWTLPPPPPPSSNTTQKATRTKVLGLAV